MAKCEYCGREMLTANGCTMRYVVIGTIIIPRMKVGEEGSVEPGHRCGDCGALYGHYHHFGCDTEQCPVCAGQMMCCDCGGEHDDVVLTTTKKVAQEVVRKEEAIRKEAHNGSDKCDCCRR